MPPVASDPTKYRLHVVSFSCVRESSSLKTKLADPAAVVELARQLVADDAKEHFWVALLDAQNQLVAMHQVSTGTLSASLVHPREVFAPALRIMGVSSLILIHNHPSGDATPSREDIRLTADLVAAAKLLKLSIHDHVIIGDGTSDWTSFAQRGLL